MAPVESKNLLAQIRKIAKSLYLIEPKALASLLKNVEYFSEEGLLQTLSLLKDAAEKQTEILRKLAEKDPHLNKKLKHFLDKEYQSHAKDFDLAERESAETILNEL